MTFEQERIANEQAQALHDRIAEILEGVENPTPHQLVAAIGQAQEDLEPYRGELVYEMEDVL